MYITHLSLTNFRNYGRLELDLPTGTTLLHGDNAQGKTNLLEAIYYLATSRSPHAEQDSHLINWEATQAGDLVTVGRLVADFVANTGEHQIEMRLIQEAAAIGPRSKGRSFRRQVLVDRRKVRLMDLLGNLRVVLFLPEDMQLITGSPGGRRRYLDITLCQIDPIYCRTLSQYNKVLEQRNALLRQLAEGSGNKDLLPIYTERLVEAGSLIITRRAGFMAEIGREAQRIHYEELTDDHETIRLNYLPRLTENGSSRNNHSAELVSLGAWVQENENDPQIVAQRFQTVLKTAEPAELARGMTIIGPHRDDWQFWIDGHRLASFGSRGQQRSAILALKLAEITWMEKVTDDAPILLLDEVVAELDQKRRALLLSYIRKSGQTILTATDPGMFTADFLRHATSMSVADGRIFIDQPA